MREVYKMTKRNEMKKEAMENIIETLKDGYSGHYSDLHNEVFNTGYYTIGTYKATKALEEYGTFNAIGEVTDYEKDNFGEVTTDISNPEKVINMLFYIIGEEVISEIGAISDHRDNVADDETNNEILETIK